MSNPYYSVHAFPASAAVEPYRFLAISAGEVAGTSAIDDVPFGVSLQGVALGEACSSQIDGVCFLEVDGSGTAIAAGDLIMPKAAGAGVGVAAAVGGTISARAIDAASTAGAVIRVQLLDPITVQA